MRDSLESFENVRKAAFFLLATSVTMAAQLAAADRSVQYPLKVSSNHRYLIDQKGQPYLIQGDAPWSLIVGASNDEVERYLADRHAKGFNTLLINLIEHKFCTHPPQNKDGVAPFTTPMDFSTPNEKYFAHADWVIKRAADYGMQVLLAPMYLGAKGTDEGFYEETLANGPEKCRIYGEYLGKRYSHFDNIIWVMGGDRDPDRAWDDVNAVAAGIKRFDPRHIFTAHCQSEHSAVEDYGQTAWLDLNNTYTYALIHPKLLDDYHRKPVRPFFLIETTYEGEHNSTPVQIRRQAYWADLSGSTGQVMGNCPVWGFDYYADWEKGDETIHNGELYQFRNFDILPGLKRGLDSAASRDMAVLSQVFASRPWYTLIPDEAHSVLTAGLGEFRGLDHVMAARADDGSTVIVYTPSARTVTVDLTKISGTEAQVWWVDPQTGQARSAGTFPTRGTHKFTPPQAGDWVLVLDDAAKQFSIPGKSN